MCQNNNNNNTSYGIEEKSHLAVRESPFSYLLNIKKSVLANLFIMLLFLKMRNGPLEAAEYPLRPLAWDFEEMTCFVTCRLGWEFFRASF